MPAGISDSGTPGGSESMTLTHDREEPNGVET